MRWLSVLVLVMFAVIAGCTSGSADNTVAPPVAEHAERGPVSLTVEATPGEVTVGDRFTLVIEAVAENGVDLRLPSFDETIGDFNIYSESTPLDVPDGETRRWRRTYELGAFDAGDLGIPAVAVAFTDRRGDEPVDGEVITAAFTLSVQSIGEAELRDIKSVVDVPGLSWPWWVWLILVLVLMSVVLIILYVKSTLGEDGAAAVVVPRVAAHVWAMAELDRLEADDLVAQDDLHGFFFRLSDVVRQYLERRFEMSAPERTTEEFIREMQGDVQLDDEHQQTLRSFLRSADKVKFALHRPPAEHCREAMGTVRSFVEQTRRVEAAPGPTADVPLAEVGT